MNSLAGLPYLPVSMGDLQESPLFLSADARLVRAGLYMLDAAWRSAVPGSIPSAFNALAQHTRLSEAEVQAHYDLLTVGWELRQDGRLYHAKMAALCDGLDDRFGPQIDALSQGSVIAAQGADTFELVAPEAVAKAKKKRVAAVRGIDEGFLPDAASVANIERAGYVSQEHKEWLLQLFIDYALSKGVKQKGWQATFRNFASSSITIKNFSARFGAPPSAFIVSESRAVAQSAPSFGHQAAAFKNPAFAAAADRIRQQQGAGGFAPRPTFARQTLDENRAVIRQAMQAARPAAVDRGGFYEAESQT